MLLETRGCLEYSDAVLLPILPFPFVGTTEWAREHAIALMHASKFLCRSSLKLLNNKHVW